MRNRLKWYILGKHSGHVLSPGVHNKADCNSSMLIDIEDVHSAHNTDQTSNFLENENIIEEEIFMDTSTVEEISVNQRREETGKQEETGEGITKKDDG